MLAWFGGSLLDNDTESVSTVSTDAGLLGATPVVRSVPKGPDGQPIMAKETAASCVIVARAVWPVQLLTCVCVCVCVCDRVCGCVV